MTPSALLLAALSLLVVVGWRVRRRRLRERLARPPIEVDDDTVRTIEEGGRVSTPEDDPLDFGEIEAEEERFWKDERWDAADRL
ncbi:MAG: hypothetical protein RQ745_01920 [Longimicrobiales bacterium]|nr:hypothetical protein [Longimicrobiales bacterium]